MRLRPELRAVGASEGVVNEPLELVVAAGLAEVRRVCVHPVEVGRAVHELDLLGREVGEAVSEHFFHVCGVCAKVDRVGVPPDCEVQRVLRGGDV